MLNLQDPARIYVRFDRASRLGGVPPAPVPKVSDAGAIYEDETDQRIQIMHNGLRVVADGLMARG